MSGLDNSDVDVAGNVANIDIVLWAFWALGPYTTA
jgi:hypothetical protein